MNVSLKLSAIVALTALAATACGKDEPPPSTPPGTYGAGQPGYPQPGQPGYQPGQPGQPPPGYPQPGQPGQPPPGYPQPGAPTAQPTAPATPGIPGFPPAAPAGGGGGSAQAIDPNLAQMAAGPMMVFANGEAPGMQKEGNTAAANFSTGQTLEGNFTIQPGKCYTLVAAGAGVTSIDLEMFLITPIPGMQGSFAKNTSKGAQTSIGGKANCVKLALSPIPVQAKWVATAKAGAGLVAVQLYSK